MTDGWLCSADAHILEPGNLWVERLPSSLRARAPRIEFEDDCRIYGVEGRRLSKIPLALDYLADGRPAPPDVAERLRLLDQDGIWAESIIGSLAASVLLGIADPELAIASARVYNDYMIETFSAQGDRELVIGLIPVNDVDDAVAEIERVTELGAAGVTMPISPPAPYFLPQYAPLWAAASACERPVSFHAGTGFSSFGNVPGTNLALDQASQDGMKTAAAMMLAGQAYMAMASLIGAGVLERHPELHIVFVETNAGWLASALAAMDYAWTPTPGEDRATDVIRYDDDGNEVVIPIGQVLGGTWRHPLRPSEYAKRQVHATFMDEPGAVALRDFIGTDCLLWGSDFPHPEGTWPHSRAVVDRLFAGVPEDQRTAITGGTFAKLYGVSAPAWSASV
jgi:predicted TIM-barrel fold metal-dependent hydrolase